MTLSPVDSRDVRGVPSTRYKINPTCANPECADPSEPGAHHAFRRSQIIGDSYFVSIDGGDPIPHAVGLCSEHHRRVTDNEAWIRLDEREFVWLDSVGYSEEDGLKLWVNQGALDPQPGQLRKTVVPKPERVKSDVLEDAKPRAVKAIRVPKGAAEEYGSEDGEALLDELVARCAELMPHRDPETPPYFTIMDALGWFALNYVPGEDG